MRSACRIISRTLPPMRRGEVHLSSIVVSILGYYKSLLEKEMGYHPSTIFSEDACLAGLFSYLGQMVLGGCIDRRVDDRDAVHFSLLYLYVDYTLDDPSTNLGEMMPKMMSALINPVMKDDGVLGGCISSYRWLLERHPKSEQALIDVFMAEVEGMSYQSNPNLSEEQYLYIAEKKGGLTVLSIVSLLDSVADRNVYRIGSIVQLLDDMMDVDEDIEAGIHTIATYHVSRYGVMDRLWSYTVHQIDLLSDKYSCIKMIMLVLSTYILGIHSSVFSPSLVCLMREYTYTHRKMKEMIRLSRRPWP